MTLTNTNIFKYYKQSSVATRPNFERTW